MVKRIQSRRSNGKRGWADLPVIDGLTREDVDKSLWCQLAFASSYDGFENSMFPTAWMDISIVLSQYKIPLHLSSPYRLSEGLEVSLPIYLLQLASEHRSTKLQAAASLVDAIFLIEARRANNIDVSDLMNDFYGYSYRMAVSMLEDKVLAGQSRTGEATHSRKQQGKKNKAEALEMARTIKQSNPRLSKKDLARQITKVMPLAENTIYKYLTE